MDHPATPENTLVSLEFPFLLEILASKSRTPYGRILARALRPTPSLSEARELQAATREMLHLRTTQGGLPLSVSLDARPLLERLAVEGSLLTGQEINVILHQVRAGGDIRNQLERCDQPSLRREGREMPDLANLVRYLDGKIANTGVLEDRCSSLLQRIRGQIALVTGRLGKMLREISAGPEVGRVLQDSFVALRSNRHVLPIRVDGQSSVEGIVHALSSSGATVYMEPLATVPLNNELVHLKEQEETEVRKVLLDFSDLLRSRLAELHSLLDRLGKLDLVNARATLSEEMNGVEPALIEPTADPGQPRLRLRQARHPLLERSLAGNDRRLVPLDLQIDPSHNVLVISGPNTGGKTVVLKTVGLFALMAQSGLQVPAREAQLPVFHRVLIEIGDHQSIPENLSTFSARMMNLSEMARDFDPLSLVLLDEVGTGTDPEEGASLGAAIIDFFRNRDAIVLATTHHELIKAYASTTPGIQNASMDFDEKSLAPLYRLRTGVPGRSSGLGIAERLGVPPQIIRQARLFLPRQRSLLEDYLKSLDLLRDELDRKGVELEREREEIRHLESKRAEAARALSLDREARFAQTLEEIESRIEMSWNSYLDGIKDQETKRRLRRELERGQREMASRARTALPPDLRPARSVPKGGGELKPGDLVSAPGLRLLGSIERLDGDRAVVRAGPKRIVLPLSELQARSGAERPTSLPAGVQLSRPSAPPVRLEIHLIGRRVEEALRVLDKYLDDASLAGLTQVRVVHGVGSGKLRAAIREFLSQHPHVAGFSDAGEREGGRGATWVRMKT